MTTDSPSVTLQQSEEILRKSRSMLQDQQDMWDAINRITIPLKRRGEKNHFSEGIRKMFDDSSH